MKSQGRLDEQDILELVQELSAERWTGLAAARARRRAHHDHRRGRQPRLRLLLQPRPPARPDAPAARRDHAAADGGRRPRRSSPGKRFGTVLVERGFLEPKELVRGVVDQTRDIILHAFHWTWGTYELQEGASPAEAITLDISTPAAHPRRHLADRGVEPRRAGLRGARGAPRAGRRGARGCSSSSRSTWTRAALLRSVKAVARRGVAVRGVHAERLRGLPEPLGVPGDRPHPARPGDDSRSTTTGSSTCCPPTESSRVAEPLRADLSGKTCLVTGASAGIGLAAAHGARPAGGARGDGGAQPREGGEGAPRDHGRDRPRGRDGGGGPREPASRSARSPATSPRATRSSTCSSTTPASGPSAGKVSPDGIELVWATNVLGYFLVTELLLPLLQAAGKARVVNVASQLAGGLDLDDVAVRAAALRRAAPPTRRASRPTAC